MCVCVRVGGRVCGCVRVGVRVSILASTYFFAQSEGMKTSCDHPCKVKFFANAPHRFVQILKVKTLLNFTEARTSVSAR